MRSAPAPAVLEWFASQEAARLFLSAVSEAELRAGAAYLPAGRRREGLTAAIDAVVAEDFNGRILPFDSAAAKSYAVVAAARRAAGSQSRRRTARLPPSPWPMALRWRRGT
jgi:toxin FitB